MLGTEDDFLEIPFFGWLYAPILAPPYYKIDTELMFQEAVRQAVHEVIDGLTTAKGIRALTELERKPILHELVK
jgi:hypothetical protein